MDELKLEIESKVYGDFLLRAQEHELATGLETYLRKTGTRRRNKGGSAPTFSSALHALLLLCVRVLLLKFQTKNNIAN
jgi:hypothetical protein